MKSISMRPGVVLFLIVLLAEASSAQHRQPRTLKPANQPQNKVDPILPIPVGADIIPYIIDSSAMANTLPTRKSVKTRVLLAKEAP